MAQKYGSNVKNLTLFFSLKLFWGVNVRIFPELSKKISQNSEENKKDTFNSTLPQPTFAK